jgi:hypothetical protein
MVESDEKAPSVRGFFVVVDVLGQFRTKAKMFFFGGTSVKMLSHAEHKETSTGCI